MASPKKHYWRQESPMNKINLAKSPEKILLPTEDLGRPEGVPIGYAIVDDDMNKLVEPLDGMYGVSKGTKEEYERLKKKNQSSPSEPLWREEIKADGLRRSKTVAKNAVGAKEPAAAAVEGQAKEKTLPEDSKPKVGKRKAATKTED